MSEEKTTSLTQLNLADLKALGQIAVAQAKQSAHERNLPFSQVVDDKLYRQLPDGAMELVETLTERPSTEP